MPCPSSALRRRGRPLLLGLSLLLAAGSGARAQDTGPRIAAVVDDTVITTQDLNDRLSLALATTGVPSDPETRRRLTQQVLRGYIDEKLQVEKAAQLKLDVTAAEVEQALKNIAQRNNLDLDSLGRALAERKVDVQVLRDQIRGQIAWAKVVNRELRPRVAISQDQVDRGVRDAQSGQNNLQLLVSEILLPVDNAAQEPQVVRDAAGIVSTLRTGADFASLARQVSVAASSDSGGDLGWIRPDQVLPELRARLAALPAGGVSDPLPSPAGVHIFKVRERRSPNEPKKRLVVTRVDLAQVVVPVPQGAKPAEAKEIEGKARALSSQLKSCGDVEAAGRRLATLGSGRLGWLGVSDLPAPLQQLVNALQPNEISPPVRSGVGYQLLMVCDRQGREETLAAPPPPPPPTADQMRAQLESEQLERLATRYLRELRRDAFIDVRILG